MKAERHQGDPFLEVANCEVCDRRVYRVILDGQRGTWRHALLGGQPRHPIRVAEQASPTRMPKLSADRADVVRQWDVLDAGVLGAIVDCSVCGGWGYIDVGRSKVYPETCSVCDGDGALHREYGRSLSVADVPAILPGRNESKTVET